MGWLDAVPLRLRMLVLVLAGVLACSPGTDSAPGQTPSSSPAPSPSPAPKTVSHESVSMLIGPEGGVLEHPTGAKIVVPVGALSSATTLSITGIDAPADVSIGGPVLGQGFDMTPEGTVFQRAVEVTLPFDATRIPAGTSAETAQIYTAPKGSQKFDALATTIDLAAGLARAETGHFSTFVAAVNPNPVFVTTKSPLPGGVVGTAYSTGLAATGGTPPYRWSLVAGGAGLPPGLALAEDGTLSGTPTTPGAFEFNVLVEDAGTSRVQKWLALVVNPAANPVPTITTLTPNSASQGAATMGVTVTGTGFVPGSVVQWNGTSLTTAYVSATQVRGTITTAHLSAAGTAQITVFSPTPGGGTSNALPFTVNAVAQNPIPTVTSIDPSSGSAGDPDTQIVVNGTGFIATSKAVIGAQVLSTLFVSTTQLEAIVPASYLANAGTLQIAVNNPAPGGGTSGAKPFTVGAVNPVPTLTSISPSSTNAGSASFVMTLTGTGFLNGGLAFFGATALTTNVASATTATAQVPASLVVTGGTTQVTFVNPAPGGGASNAQTFTTNAVSPAPAISYLDRTGVRTGSNELPLAVYGSGFAPGAIVYANGTALTTVYWSSALIDATVPSTMLAGAQTLTVTAKNPSSPASNGVSLVVAASGNAIPAISAVSPASATLGASSALPVTVTGTGIATNAVLYWRFPGEPLALHLNRFGTPVSVNSSTSMSATLHAMLFQTAGQHKVLIVNQAPGGGASTELTFDVTGTNPLPDIASLAPAGPIGAGTSDLALTLTGPMPGPSFVSRTLVTATRAGGGAVELGRCGAYANSCTVTVPTSLLAQPGTLTIAAISPAPGGGPGMTATIDVVAGNPTPQITSVSPSTLTKGASPSQRVVINGKDFTAATTVKELYSNTMLPLVSQTGVQLQLDVAQALLDGTYANLKLEVTTPAPGGGSVTTADLPVVAAPFIVSTSPEPFAKATAFTMTITGTNLDLAGAKTVGWDGAGGAGTKAPTTTSATQWTVDFSATDFPHAGTANFWIDIAGHPRSDFKTVTAQ